MSSRFTVWRGFMRIIAHNCPNISAICPIKTAPLQNAARAIEYGAIHAKEAVMQMRRFKIDARAIDKSACVIRDPDANHIVNVLRLKAGDRVVLFDGAGQEYEAVIAQIIRGEVRLSIERSRRCQVESPVRITLAQGFLKDKKMDTLIRQLTELGISRWIPFFGARSVPRPDTKRLARRAARWQKIADEALKQCGRAQAPRIETVADFSEMLRLAGASAVKLIFWEAEEAAFPEIKLVTGTDHREVFIVLGPEGGLTAGEIELARQAGFVSVSLGPRILRAETATIAAGTLVQYLYGDLGKGRS